MNKFTIAARMMPRDNKADDDQKNKKDEYQNCQSGQPLPVKHPKKCTPCHLGYLTIIQIRARAHKTACNIRAFLSRFKTQAFMQKF